MTLKSGSILAKKHHPASFQNGQKQSSYAFPTDGFADFRNF
jgi:hypothetical protein